jgi:hypothetical protein
VQRLRLLGLHGFARRFPDLGLHASAANSPHDGAVIAYQHLGRLKRGNRSAHIDDRRQGSATAFPPQPGYLFIDVHRDILMGLPEMPKLPKIAVIEGNSSCLLPPWRVFKA